MSTRKSARSSTAASKADPAATPVSETAVAERSTRTASPAKRRTPAKATKASAKAAVSSSTHDNEVELKPDVRGTSIPQRAPPSRVVFSTPEIKRRMLSLLDRGSLAGMMALEKASVADVASVLYKTIPVSVVTKISRNGPRRETYCQSVQEIDRSPPTDPTSQSTIPSATPISLVPETLLENASSLCLAFPNLRRILYQYPANEADDTFVVHLPSSDGPVIVDINSYVKINIANSPNPSNALLPPQPKQIPGMVTRHTLRLDIICTKTSLSGAMAERYRAWLVSPYSLDERVTGFLVSSAVRKKMELSHDDIKAFVTRRKAKACEPVKGLHLMISSEDSVSRIREIAHLAGPQVETIYLESLTEQSDWPEAVKLLGKAFPLLQKLTIEDAPSDKKRFDVAVPLSGLAHLRYLRIAPSSDGVRRKSPPPPIGLARYLCGLGRSDCFFIVPGYEGQHLSTQLHRLIRGLRSCRPEYSYLNTVDINDLDLWDPADISLVPTTSDRLKRDGCGKSAGFARICDTQQKELDELALSHRTIANRLNSIFAGVAGDVSGKEGNLKAQGEALKKRFEKVAEQKKKLDDVCSAMHSKLSAVQGTADAAARYAAKWLARHQGRKGV